MHRDYHFANIGIRRHPRLGYGHFLVYGIVEGTSVSAMTTNTQIYDFWNDKENPCKMKIARGWIKHRLARAYYDQLQEEGAL